MTNYAEVIALLEKFAEANKKRDPEYGVYFTVGALQSMLALALTDPEFSKSGLQRLRDDVARIETEVPA